LTSREERHRAEPAGARALHILSLALAVAATGCASTTTTSARSTTAQAQRSEPRCRTNALLLAAATHKPKGAILAAASDGFAMVWGEQAERATLRFLLVNRAGGPRSPSVEVVDRAAPMLPLDVHLIGEAGYEIAWQEAEGKVFARQLDGRGRPRADVVDGARPALGTPAPTVCAAAGAGLRCKTPYDIPLELPAGVAVLAERIDHDGAAVIGADAQGLKLFVQACARE
jgi:hypothetical protein